MRGGHLRLEIPLCGDRACRAVRCAFFGPGQVAAEAGDADRAVRGRRLDRCDRTRGRRGDASFAWQSIVIDNRGGAGGSLGTAAIAKASPDGQTIGMGTASTLAINPAAYKNLSYDILRDLKPIGLIASVPNVISVHPSVPAKTVAELVALAKAQPGKLTYGSAGNGSVSHLMGEQFKLATDTDIIHVPYRGVGPALNDAVGGQIQILFDNLPTSLPLIQDGKLRALAVSSPQRLAALPDVPTFAELKLSDLDWMAFFGLVAPAKTSPDRDRQAQCRAAPRARYTAGARGAGQAAGDRRAGFARRFRGADRSRIRAHEAWRWWRRGSTVN